MTSALNHTDMLELLGVPSAPRGDEYFEKRENLHRELKAVSTISIKLFSSEEQTSLIRQWFSLTIYEKNYYQTKSIKLEERINHLDNKQSNLDIENLTLKNEVALIRAENARLEHENGQLKKIIQDRDLNISLLVQELIKKIPPYQKNSRIQLRKVDSQKLPKLSLF